MADRETIGLIGLGVLFLLLMLRIPVGLAMIAVGIGGNYALSQAVSFLRFEPYLKQFKTLFFNSVANYDLSVVPLFILMGYLASETGMSRDLFTGMRAVVGRVRGGVAMAAIAACAGFGAVCGSSLATASTMGKVALPELRRMNYSVRLATGTLAAGGTLGILIPPSIALIIYALIVEASIIEMFQAAMSDFSGDYPRAGHRAVHPDPGSGNRRFRDSRLWSGRARRGAGANAASPRHRPA